MVTLTQSQCSLPSSFEVELIAEKGEYRHCRHGLRKPSWLSVPSSLWSELSKIPEFGPHNTYIYIYILLRIIALPSVKYSGRVEMDVLGGVRQVASQPFLKITFDPESCMTMLLEKLRKSDWSLEDCYLCLQCIFKNEPWLVWVSGETRWAARTCHLLIELASLFIQKLHNSTNLGANSKPS